MSDAAFYCVADERYFLGAAAMINSLRLQGHTEPVLVLDLGLAGCQRDLLGAGAELIEARADTPPWLAKTVVPRQRPAPVMVLIDADMIVTRPLRELIDAASEDRVVAFRNDTERHVAEWGELLELGPQRRRPYVSSGLVALGGPIGTEVLELLDDRQRAVDPERIFAGGDDAGYPLLYPEQDVLNAILCTRIPDERVLRLENRLAPNPPYSGLRIADERRLRCTHRDGTEPFVLHQFVRKPWLEPMYHGIWSRLFVRCLLADDVAIRVPPEALPRRMRGGLRGRAERAAIDAADLGRWHLTERLPRWLRRR